MIDGCDVVVPAEEELLVGSLHPPSQPREVHDVDEAVVEGVTVTTAVEVVVTVGAGAGAAVLDFGFFVVVASLHPNQLVIRKYFSPSL